MTVGSIASLRAWIERRFVACLAVVGVAGFAIPLTFVVRRRWDVPIGGDGYFYYWQARLLTEGHGFIAPAFRLQAGITRDAADHPPLFTLFLSALDLVGLRSVNTKLVVQCVIVALTVVVIGLAGRAIGGAVTGLIAAAIAATYPSLWINAGMLLSEPLFLLIIATMLWLTYRYVAVPTTRRAAAIAVLIGLATLTRAEALLLVPLVLVPTVVRGTRGAPLVRRAGAVLGLAVVAGLVVSPWVVFNLARFEKPMLLSADGITLAAGNCDATYQGPLRGYLDLTCIPNPGKGRVGPALKRYLETHDESLDNVDQRAKAFRYMRDHIGEVPGVMLARVGRMWQLWRVGQTRRFDIDFERRDPDAVTVGFWYTYALMPLAITGGVMLSRRRVPILPLVMLVVIATFSAATTFGVLRYRAIAEPALVLLAAVPVATALSSLARRTRAAPASRS